MLNFLTNVFQKNSNARTVCGNYDGETDVIQACAGCDSDCLFSCYSMCANECQGNTQDTGGGGGNCNSQCTGTCFSVASIIGGK